MKSRPSVLRGGRRWTPKFVFLLLAVLAACGPPAGSQTVRAPAESKGGTVSERREPAKPSPESSAKTDELVLLHIAARGGIENLHALQSLRMTGTARFG